MFARAGGQKRDLFAFVYFPTLLPLGRSGSPFSYVYSELQIWVRHFNVEGQITDRQIVDGFVDTVHLSFYHYIFSTVPFLTACHML
jgi:hypothetical protein